MTYEQLTSVFNLWGWRVPPQSYYRFKAYLQTMLRMNRVMVITDEGSVVAILLFYITDNLDRTSKKMTFDIGYDNPEGHIFFIDKLICKKFTPSMHRIIKRHVLATYPRVQDGYYLREPKDRCCKIIGRRSNELQSSVS